MKISTLLGSTLLIGTLGLGLSTSAQAHSSYLDIHLYGSDHYIPLHYGYHYRKHRHHRHHGHGHHHRTYRKAPRHHYRHHDRHGQQNRHHERYDDHAGKDRHHSSHRTGIGYTGHR
jgi:hypothetical protein